MKYGESAVDRWGVLDDEITNPPRRLAKVTDNYRDRRQGAWRPRYLSPWVEEAALSRNVRGID